MIGLMSADIETKPGEWTAIAIVANNIDGHRHETVYINGELDHVTITEIKDKMKKSKKAIMEEKEAALKEGAYFVCTADLDIDSSSGADFHFKKGEVYLYADNEPLKKAIQAFYPRFILPNFRPAAPAEAKSLFMKRQREKYKAEPRKRKFLMPVSMKVQKAFTESVELLEVLKKWGYKYVQIMGEGDYLTTGRHLTGHDGEVFFGSEPKNGMHFLIDPGNRKLFLALAAMSEGIKFYPGEVLYCVTAAQGGWCVAGNLYGFQDLDGEILRLADLKSKGVLTTSAKAHTFRKATMSEIMQHFQHEAEKEKSNKALKADIDNALKHDQESGYSDKPGGFERPEAGAMYSCIKDFAFRFAYSVGETKFSAGEIVHCREGGTLMRLFNQLNHKEVFYKHFEKLKTAMPVSDPDLLAMYQKAPEDLKTGDLCYVWETEDPTVTGVRKDGKAKRIYLYTFENVNYFAWEDEKPDNNVNGHMRALPWPYFEKVPPVKMTLDDLKRYVEIRERINVAVV